MIAENELLFLLALQRAPGVGDLRARKLIRACGSAEQVFKEVPGKLIRIDGVGAAAIKAVRQKKNLLQAEKELKWLKENRINVLPFTGVNFPERLNHCPDGPLVLFTKGKIDWNAKRYLSVVGTRRLTPHGREFCEQFISDLTPFSPVIVSGYAYGADICAHLSATDHELQTLACMAHGLNFTYPGAHRRYNERMMANGGFITDFWSDEGPERDHFLRRNRIIAGLSEAVVVIESAEKGGSLVTADIANSYNRDVFAVPGKPGDPYSKGCNALIKSHQAHLLESAADLVYILGWDAEQPEKPAQQGTLFPDMNPDEETVFAQLNSRGKMRLDDIADSCGLPVQKVSAMLLGMEIKGVVRPLPGKFFKIA